MMKKEAKKGKSRWRTPVFVISVIIMIAGEIAWNWWYASQQQNMDILDIQAILLSWWVIATLIITLHEKIYTKKKVIHATVPFIIVFISIFIPVINILILLPLAYYLTIKNIAKAIKEPDKYGGLALSILAIGFATITLVKSIEVYIMSYKGIISFG